MPLYGTGPVTFVDEFNEEFSRDIEPMKGGHGDNYYYQMIANIRKYKGVRPIPPVVPRRFEIDGKFDDWVNVEPEFRDTIGDPVHRDFHGWGTSIHYVNATGRNDIVAAKVSLDDKSVGFYARTRAKLSDPGAPHFMLLFVDSDHDVKTGWLGYDFVVNRKPGGSGVTSVERHEGNGYRWGNAVEVPFRVAGNELELSIPRSVLGVNRLPGTLDFKWADNIAESGDWSDFTLNGDTAPNDRYNYRAILRGAAP
jgi:hypothetical protein